jgi:aryl-alcohol dehydrogenase-like predicted oxidoreductase
METLNKLRDEGKIRYIGISNYSPKQTKEAIQYGAIHSSQPRYNLFFRDEDPTLKFCLENGIGVIPHSVLAKGLLSGKYGAGHEFAPDDERRRFNFFKGEMFDEANSIVQKLKDWAEDHNRDIVQLAIAWVLAHPAVSSAIVGAKSPEQVYQNAKAADWKLSESDLREIESIVGDFRPTWVKYDE